MSEGRREIRIVTGPHGAVVGSEVFVDGERIDRLSYVELSGEIGGCWRLTTTQVLSHRDKPLDILDILDTKDNLGGDSDD